MRAFARDTIDEKKQAVLRSTARICALDKANTCRCAAASGHAEHQIQLNSYGEERTIACDLLPSRYDQVAQALGAHGERVEDPAELEGAIERAVAAGKPACVDVLIEPAAAPSLLVGGSHP